MKQQETAGVRGGACESVGPIRARVKRDEMGLYFQSTDGFGLVQAGYVHGRGTQGRPFYMNLDLIHRAATTMV